MPSPSLAHPNYYRRLAALSQARAAGLLEMPAEARRAFLAREFSGFDGDELGFEGRMDYAGTVSHVWEKYMAGDRLMYKMADKLPETSDLAEIVISELPALRLPDSFYAHFGEATGLYLDGNPDVFIDGVYFWHTTDFGDPLYMYVVTCGSTRKDVENMSLAELTIEITRVAIGTIEPSQQFSDTLIDLIGDPSVCRAVQDTVVKDVIALTLAFIADPKAVPDLSREINLSAVAPHRGFRN